MVGFCSVFYFTNSDSFSVVCTISVWDGLVGTSFVNLSTLDSIEDAPQTEHRNPEGRTYWYNTGTKASVWEKPDGERILLSL